MKTLRTFAATLWAWLGALSFLLNPVFLGVVLLGWLLGWIKLASLYARRAWEGWQVTLAPPLDWLPFVDADLELSLGLHVKPWRWRLDYIDHSPLVDGPYYVMQFLPFSLTFFFADVQEVSP